MISIPTLNKIAARQAFGIAETISPSPDKIANKTNPCMTEARGVFPPNLMFATVRIVAVAVVTPPKIPAAILAMPCPKVSLSLLWRVPVILSATLQLRRLSNTARAANANAGPINSIVLFMLNLKKPYIYYERIYKCKH